MTMWTFWIQEEENHGRSGDSHGFSKMFKALENYQGFPKILKALVKFSLVVGFILMDDLVKPS